MALEWGTYCLRNLWEIPLEWLSSPASVDCLHLDCHTLEPLPWSEWISHEYLELFLYTLNFSALFLLVLCIAGKCEFSVAPTNQLALCAWWSSFQKTIGRSDSELQPEEFSTPFSGIVLEYWWLSQPHKLNVDCTALFAIAKHKPVCLFVGSGRKAILSHIVFVLSLESLAFMSIESLALFTYTAALLWFWSWVFEEPERMTKKIHCLLPADVVSHSWSIETDCLMFLPCWSVLFLFAFVLSVAKKMLCLKVMALLTWLMKHVCILSFSKCR